MALSFDPAGIPETPEGRSIRLPPELYV